MQELITALIKARQEFQPIRKDKVNPFLKNKYATLDSVLEAVEPALSAHGLTIVQTTDLVSTSEGSLPMQALKTALYHESGQCITGVYQLPVTDDQQKMGAAITYARRYGICAILNVTADADDDGNSSSKTAASVAPTVKKPQPEAVSGEFTDLMQQTDDHLKRLGWSKEKGRSHLESTYGKRSRQALTDTELQDFLSFLKLQPSPTT